jgi:aminoglycoside phosphotransferase family enzyme
MSNKCTLPANSEQTFANHKNYDLNFLVMYIEYYQRLRLANKLLFAYWENSLTGKSRLRLYQDSGNS